MKKTNLVKSIDTLVKALEKDGKEPGSYYYVWQANIAMSFYDEYRRAKPKNLMQIHKTANKAAKNFLDLLCKRS